MGRLRSARLTDDTLVSQIDDYFAELESDLADIFGFTLDADITASPFSIDNSGRLTKQLIAWSAPVYIVESFLPGGKQLGLNIANSTNEYNVGVGVFGIRQYPSEVVAPVFGFWSWLGNPAWFGGSGETDFDIDVNVPGFLFLTEHAVGSYWGIRGHTVISTSQGLIPKSNGNVSEGLSGMGTWIPLGRPSESCRVEAPIDSTGASTGITVGSTVVLSWHAETYDTSGLHGTDDDEVILAQAGQYHVVLQVQVRAEVTSGSGGGSPGAGTITTEIWRDRATVLTQWAKSSCRSEDTSNIIQAECEAFIDCSAADGIYGKVIYACSQSAFTLVSGSLSVTRIA